MSKARKPAPAFPRDWGKVGGKVLRGPITPEEAAVVKAALACIGPRGFLFEFTALSCELRRDTPVKLLRPKAIYVLEEACAALLKARAPKGERK